MILNINWNDNNYLMPNPLQSDFWQTRTPAVPVGKRRAYIIVPAFDFESPDPYSKPTVIGQINYQIDNNFTINFMPDFVAQHYPQACIKYIVGTTVTRYRLFQSALASDNLNIFAPLYTGQVILKNFTIEFWAKNKANNAGRVIPLAIPISVLVHRSTLDEADTFDASGTLVQVDNPNMRVPFGTLFGTQFWPQVSIGNTN